MYIKDHSIDSGVLGQKFDFRVYGHEGKPVMVFPTSSGRFFDYEDRGMINAIEPYINAGDIQVFAVDSRDAESWQKPVRDEWIARRHEHYEGCILNDVIPFVQKEYGVNEKFIGTGCSFGAFHSANFFFKYPRSFDGAVCLSGCYSARVETGDYYDGGIYFSDPVAYLPNLNDEATLAKLRRGYIIIAHGGAWEFPEQSHAIAEQCRIKKIPCLYDDWGHKYNHDWPTWLVQIKKFMELFKTGAGTDYSRPSVMIGQHRRISLLEK